MKYALIGCGRISPNHIEAAKNNNLEFVAMCDIVPEVMQEKSDRFELEAVHKYTDYKELLEKEKPELVAIATESGKHAAIALDCIAAGCHVIIEKPIALSIADADAIIEAGEKAGVVVCANHQNRFNKSVQYMRKALEAGRFGRLSHGAAHVRWNRGKGYYDQAPWRGTWAQDGGCLMNQCIHNIDLLRWFMGDDVEEVMAYTDQLEHPYLEAEDLGMALVKFSNGSYGLIEGTTNVYPKNLEETLYIFGEKGTAKAAGTSDNRSIADAMPGVDYIFHAAALKQVPSCEFFPMQAVKTNVEGTDNVLHAAIDAGVKRVVCLSTDKAAYPINAMGISKAMMEHVIYANARVAAERSDTVICCTRYGNVMCSRGSVIPLFIDQIHAGNPITITNPEMTRFLMNLDEAVELVRFAFNHANPGDLFIQKADASTIGDLAKGVQKLFGDTGTNIIGTRHGEKLYETLMTREERLRSEDMGNYFRVAADNRDLNYDKYFIKGHVMTEAEDSYTSHNTTLLDVDGVVKKILTTDYVKEQLGML